MTRRYQRTFLDRYTPLFFVMWLLYTMNSILQWYSFGVIFRGIGFLGIVLYSLSNQKKRISGYNQYLALFVLLYYIWALLKMNLDKSNYLVAVASISVTFVSFVLVVSWPETMLKRCYDLFRSLVIFFAVGSSIITILTLFGNAVGLPYIEMPAQSALHENIDDYYRMYLYIFPVLVRIGEFTSRACGMMEEPGHFSIVLGFVYLIDRYTNRRNYVVYIIIFVAAILAFSSTFFLIALFTEWQNIIKYWRRVLLILSIISATTIFIYNLLPVYVQDLVYVLAYERNAEKVIDTYKRTGSITEALDERADDKGRSRYKNLSISQTLIGGSGDRYIIMSDYRGFIITVGLIGLVLVVLISLSTLIGIPLELKVALGLTLLMIFMHRSWFFYEPFPYCMSFIANSLYNLERRLSCQTL